MADRLLPFTASELEQTIEQVHATGIDNIPLSLSTLWNPATCPAHLLPWLAWALSIDSWDSDWSDEIKRALIAGNIALHRQKGTLAALRQILAAVDVPFEIEEWFQTGAQPYTFQLTTDAVAYWLTGLRPLDNTLFSEIRAIVDPVKPLRSHYTTRINIGAENALDFANSASVYTVLRLTFTTEVRSTASPALAAVMSIVPKINGVIAPATSMGDALLPLMVKAPARISLRKKVTAALTLTPKVLQSQPIHVAAQSSSDVVMALRGRITL